MHWFAPASLTAGNGTPNAAKSHQRKKRRIKSEHVVWRVIRRGDKSEGRLVV